MKRCLAPCAQSEWQNRPGAWKAATPGRSGLSCVLLLLLAGLAGAGAQARAASPFDTHERLCQPLGPQTEKVLADLVDKAEPLQRELLNEHMKVLLDDMQVLFGLAAKERAGLELDAASMVTLAARQWKECALEGLRPLVPREGGDAAMADWVRARKRAPDLVPYHVVRRWTPPEQLPHWARALEKRLGTQRATQWLQVREDQRRKLLPAIEGFVQRCAEECRRLLNKMQNEHLQLLGSTAGFSQTETDALTARLRQLMSDHLAAEMDAMRDMLGTVPDQSLDRAMILYTLVDYLVTPSEAEVEAAWRRLLAEESGTAGLKRWDEMIARKNDEQKQRIARLLEPSLRLGRMNMEATVEGRVDTIVAMLDLDHARSMKLEALAARAVNDGLEAARLEWTRHLISMEKSGTVLDESLDAHLPSHEHNPLTRPLWLEGLRALFSTAELRQIEKDETEFYKEGLIHALARAAVVEMDQLLALDGGQRAALEKILAVELADTMTGRAWHFLPSDLLLRARSMSREALGKILDAAQLEQFPTAAEMPGPPQRVRPDAPPCQFMTEKEQRLAVVTLDLHTKIIAEREKLLQPMLVRVADARRVLHLAPEQAARLTTAAKGAVEAVVASLRESVADMASTEFANVAEDKLQEELDQVRMPCVLAKDSPARERVWLQALDEMLTPAQRAAWQKVIDERAAYRVAAMADITVAELARRYRLKDSQREKIRGLVAAVFATHLGDLDRASLSGGWEGWHLQSDCCVLPLAAVPKEKLRTVLTPRQWNQLHEEDMPMARTFWKQVQEAARKQAPASPEPLILLLDP